MNYDKLKVWADEFTGRYPWSNPMVFYHDKRTGKTIAIPDRRTVVVLSQNVKAYIDRIEEIPPEDRATNKDCVEAKELILRIKKYVGE